MFIWFENSFYSNLNSVYELFVWLTVNMWIAQSVLKLGELRINLTYMWKRNDERGRGKKLSWRRNTQYAFLFFAIVIYTFIH